MTKGTRRVFVLLPSITIVSGAFIGILFFMSSYVANRPNGFVRKTPPHLITPNAAIDVIFDSYYIAGGDSEGFYLANYTAPKQMIHLSYSLQDTTHILLQISDDIKVIPGAVRIRVDSPYVYFSEGKQPLVMYGTINDFVIDEIQDTTVFFMNSIPISKSTSMGTVYDSYDKITTLARKMTTHDVLVAPEVLEKQLDGIFDMDGLLNYDASTASFVYVYFYRNRFVRLDSSLNVLYTGRTIDTTSHVRLEVETIAATEEITMSKPPFTVNRKSCVSKDWIFINSALRANNEDDGTLKDGYPVDVYNLKTGQYKHSFYIPIFRNGKLNSMQVYGDNLVVVMGSMVQTYKLAF